MASTPLSLINISCTCTECASFLRPYPVPSLHIYPGLLSDSTSLPITPPLTAKSTPRSVPRSTISTPAPSPQFLLTRPTPSEAPRATPATLPSKHISPIVTLLSRRLLFNLSSPIDEERTPLSAKTPGLKRCAGTDCSEKALPGFGRAVCSTCEKSLKGAVHGLLNGGGELQSSARVEEDVSNRASTEETFPPALGEHESSIMQMGMETEPHEPQHNGHAKNEHLLYALPSASLTPQQHLSPSPNIVPYSPSPSKRLALKHERAKTAAGTPLFALPNATYEEPTPTIEYPANFPALPVRRDGLGRERSAERPRSEIIRMTAMWTEKRHRRKAGRPYELPALRWEGSRRRYEKAQIS